MTEKYVAQDCYIRVFTETTVLVSGENGVELILVASAHDLLLRNCSISALC